MLFVFGIVISFQIKGMEEIELKETKLEQSRSSSTSSDNLKNIQSTGELSHSERSRIPPKDEIDEHQLTVLQVAERYYSSVDEQTPLNSKVRRF